MLRTLEDLLDLLESRVDLLRPLLFDILLLNIGGLAWDWNNYRD